MKVKVVKSFIDKTNNQVRAINEEFNCTDERYAEIKKAGNYVEPVITTKKSVKEEKGEEKEWNLEN